MIKPFEQSYNSLNPQQKQAVDTIQGPVLMIAGPGSGKTHVLTMRIANIIRQTDTLPSSILALTFTETAAENMKKRLVQLIGTTGYKVKIATFHGFCNDLIQQYPENFIFTKDIKQIDDLTRVQILESIIDDNEFKDLTNFYSPYMFLKDIQQNISNLKKEGFDAKDFKEQVEKHEIFFEENKEINSKGRLKSKWKKYEKDLLKNKELSVFYEKYEESLKQRGLYDYSDMILFVTRELQENQDFLFDIRERYLYTLVDEYQDTNGAQNELLMLINSYDSKPNLFAVGDDDQSIYSFQGASVKNILEFKEKYPAAKVISTKYNYRSQQKILDAAKNSIENNQERYSKKDPSITKEMIAGNKKLKNNLPPDLLSAPPIELTQTKNNYQEAQVIKEKIEKLQNQGVDYSEIAVIYRTHSDAEDLIELLSKEDIPIITKTGNDVLDIPAIQTLSNFLKFLNDPLDSAKLIEILHYKLWKLPLIDLYKVFRKYGENKKNEELFDILIDKTQLEEAGIEASSEIAELVERILGIRQDGQNIPMSELFLRVINEFGFLKKSIEQNKTNDLNAYKSFHNFIISRSQNYNSKSNHYKLKNFCRDLESIEENNLNINTQDIMMYGDGVHLITAHSAKGLEFDYVFIMKAVDGNWGNKRDYSKVKLLNLYQTKNRHIDKEKDSDESLEEERRLFFVSMTRARKRIFITYADKYIDPNTETSSEKTPSLFVKEISEKYLDFQDKTAEQIDLAAQLTLRETTEAIQDEKILAFLQNLIENFSLSYSSFENYLECPHRFLYLNLLKVPKIQAKPMILGSAIHQSLEKIGLDIINGKLEISNKDQSQIILQAQKNIENYVKSQAISPEDKQSTIDEANLLIKEYLANFVERFIKEKRKFLKVEYVFPNVYMDSIKLTGKIDLIEAIGDPKEKHVKIIDYKTAKPKSQNAILGKTKDINAPKHYKQLVFYNLLCQLDDNFDYTIEKSAIDFIKPNRSGKYKQESFSITAKDKEDLKQEIKDVWGKIRNLQFNERCNKEDCIICQINTI